MTREEFDRLDSTGQFACPDCGSRATQPYPGCGCPPAKYGVTRHINLYHHTCTPRRDDGRNATEGGQ